MTEPDKTVHTEENLSIREIMFVSEYMIDFNATQAAIRAGYSRKSARQTAHELMGKPRIESAIKQRVQQRVKRLEQTADAVLIQMQRVAFSDIRDTDPELLGYLPDELAYALQSVKVSKRRSNRLDDNGKPCWDEVVEFKLDDRNTALAMLAKHFGLLTEKIEHSGEQTTHHKARVVIVPAKGPLPDENENHPSPLLS